jgi:hypothetical protein
MSSINQSSTYSQLHNAHPGFGPQRNIYGETQSEKGVFRGHHFSSAGKTKAESIKSDTVGLTSGEMESERITRLLLDGDQNEDAYSTRALNSDKVQHVPRFKA